MFGEMKQNNNAGFDSIGSVATAKVPLNEFTLGFPRGFEKVYKNLYNNERQYFNDSPVIQENTPYILNPNSIRANLKRQQKDYEYGRAMDRVLNTERSDERYTRTANGMGIQLKPINHVKFAAASYGANSWPASEDQNGPWEIRYFGEEPFYGIHPNRDGLYDAIEQRQPKVKPEKLEGGLRYQSDQILVQNMLKDRIDQLNAIDQAKANFNTVSSPEITNQSANILPTGDLIELNLHLQGILDSLSSVYEGEDSNRNITALNGFILKDAQKTVLLVIKLAQKMDRTELNDLMKKIQQIIYWSEKIASKDNRDLANRALGGEEFLLENEQPAQRLDTTLYGPIPVSKNIDRSKRRIKKVKGKTGDFVYDEDTEKYVNIEPDTYQYQPAGFDNDNYNFDYDIEQGIQDDEGSIGLPEEITNSKDNIKDIIGYETAETLKQIFMKLETYVQQMINGINLTPREKIQLSNAWVKELKFGQSIKSIDEVDSRIKNIMRQQGYNVYHEEAKDELRGIKRGEIKPIHADIDEFDIGDKFNPKFNKNALYREKEKKIKEERAKLDKKHNITRKDLVKIGELEADLHGLDIQLAIEREEQEQGGYYNEDYDYDPRYDPDREEQREGEYFQDTGSQASTNPEYNNFFDRQLQFDSLDDFENSQARALERDSRRPRPPPEDRRERGRQKAVETRKKNAEEARKKREALAIEEEYRKKYLAEYNSIPRMNIAQLHNYLNSSKFRKIHLSEDEHILHDLADRRLAELKEADKKQKAAKTKEKRANDKSFGKGRIQRFYDPKTGQYNIARN